MLSLENRAIAIAQGGNTARVMLEDVSVLVLDHAQISLTAPLLSACAEAQIVVITVGASHIPNGMLLPYLPHSRALKVMTAQLGMSAPTRKRYNSLTCMTWCAAIVAFRGERGSYN